MKMKHFYLVKLKMYTSIILILKSIVVIGQTTQNQSPSIIKVDKIEGGGGRGSGLSVSNTIQFGNNWFYTSDYSLDYPDPNTGRSRVSHTLHVYSTSENGDRIWSKRLYWCDTGASHPGGTQYPCLRDNIAIFNSLNLDKILYVLDSFGGDFDIGELNNNDGTIIYQKTYYNKGRIINLINDGNFYYVFSKNNLYNTHYLTKLNRDGNLVSELSFSNITSFDLSTDGLLLFSNNSPKLIRYSDFNVVELGVNGISGKLVGQDIVLSQESRTILIKPNSQIIELTNDQREIYPSDDDSFVLYKGGNFKRYNSNHDLIFDENLGILKTINFLENTIITSDNNLLRKYNSDNFSLVFERNLADLNITNIVNNNNLFILDNQKVYLSYNFNLLIELDNNGNITWQRTLGSGYLRGISKLKTKLQLTLSDYSTDNLRVLKVVLSTIDNICDYQVSTNIPENYCGRSDYNSFVGYLEGATTSCFNSIFSYEWTKNGVFYSNTNYINTTESGIYTFTLKQGSCSQNASSSLTIYRPPTSVTASPNDICVGNNSILSGNCSVGILKWYSENTLTNEVNPRVSPTISSNYFGVCNSNNCNSIPISTTVTVSSTLPDSPSVFSSFKDIVCQSAGNRMYEIASVPQSVNYEWSYTGNGVSIIPQGTQAIINFSPTASSGNVKVRSVGVCGASNYLSRGVEVIPLTIRVNDKKEYGIGSINHYRIGKSIEFLPSVSTSINIAKGAVFSASIVSCPN